MSDVGKSYSELSKYIHNYELCSLCKKYCAPVGFRCPCINLEHCPDQEHNTFSPAFVKEYLDAILCMIKQEDIPENNIVNRDQDLRVRLNYYDIAINNIKEMTKRAFDAGVRITKIYVLDNDSNLGYPKADENGLIDYNSHLSLPEPHECMRDIVDLLKNINPGTPAIVATGRKLMNQYDGTCMLCEIAGRYDCDEKYITANANSRCFPVFFDKIEKINKNTGDIEYSRKEITNGMHKTIICFIWRILCPDADIYQYDDHKKDLEIGFFGDLVARDIMMKENIRVTGDIHCIQVNLDDQTNKKIKITCDYQDFKYF